MTSSLSKRCGIISHISPDCRRRTHETRASAEEYTTGLTLLVVYNSFIHATDIQLGKFYQQKSRNFNKVATTACTPSSRNCKPGYTFGSVIQVPPFPPPTLLPRWLQVTSSVSSERPHLQLYSIFIITFWVYDKKVWYLMKPIKIINLTDAIYWLTCAK